MGSSIADKRTTFSQFVSTFQKFWAALLTFCTHYSVLLEPRRVKYLKAGFTGNSKAGFSCESWPELITSGWDLELLNS